MDGTWTRERIELIKRSICPKGISDDEFALFIEQCKRSGLDPLLKEAFCVPRRANIGSREKPNWVTRHEFQPSEAGMLTRAERMPDFLGVQACAVYAEDEILVDSGKGVVQHTFNPAKRKGALVGAWARLERERKAPIVVWLDFAAYVQSTPLWGKMPATMIEKCGRAAVLRKGYPSHFGGMYVAGERPDDVDTGEDVEQGAPVTLEKPALPPPAPRETLASAPEREKVPVTRERGAEEARLEQSREPGSDDGEPDDLEREGAVIVTLARAAKTQADLEALKPRALALPKDSPERKTAAAALTEAFGRLSKGAA